MSKAENRILTSFTVRTEDLHTTKLYKEVIEEADRVLIFEEDDGIEFKVLTVAVVNYEDYSIIRINCN